MKTEYSTQCPQCASRGEDTKGDNLKYFLNQQNKLTNKCVKCSYRHVSGSMTTIQPQEQKIDHLGLLTDGFYTEDVFRGINPDIGKKYLIQNGEYLGKPVRIYNYVNKDGEICSQKLRFLDQKTFHWRQGSEPRMLFGWQTIKDFEDTVYLTEGEEDCASVGQLGLQSLSISVGAGGQTLNEIQKHLKDIERFKKIVFVFDNDPVGQDTLKSIEKLFTPGKCWKVVLKSYKDPNDYLKAGQQAELLKELSSPVKCIPTSIVKPSLERLLKPQEKGYEICFPKLSEGLRGIKPGRIYTICAGEGAGKSSFTKELLYSLINDNKDLKVGAIYLEETLETTANSFTAIDNNVPLWQLEEDEDSLRLLTPKTYDKYIASGKIEFVDASFMELDGKELEYNIRWLAEGFGCKIIVLDHLTMVTYDLGAEASERKDIDILMKGLRRLTKETNCSILNVCHLKRPSGKEGWDQGREISLTDLRGSAAIGQLSDAVIGLERNLQSEALKNKTLVKILKNRVRGLTGHIESLYYDELTGRLTTVEQMFK